MFCEIYFNLEIPKEKIDVVMAMEITNELTIDGDTFCLKQQSGETTNVVKSTFGKQDAFKTIDGLTLKVCTVL